MRDGWTRRLRQESGYLSSVDFMVLPRSRKIQLGKALTREMGDVFCQGFPRGVFLVASVLFLRSPRLGSGSPTISGRNLMRPRTEPWEG